MHNAIIQCKRVKQTLPTFQEYGPTRYKKYKTDIVNLGVQYKQSARKIKDIWRGNPNTSF